MDGGVSLLSASFEAMGLGNSESVHRGDIAFVEINSGLICRQRSPGGIPTTRYSYQRSMPSKWQN